ncbi:response regulator [Pelosinus sp. sgz500959]|uniref:response regulator n=1 Tax=Pelosinus sp. sgz500959 TaxID=3242472 RepID=UPI003672BFC8
MKKILIVDDAIFMRNTLRNMLEKNGYEVVGEAENGEAAIQKYEELQPDITTMDITMPVTCGVEALRRIREINQGAKVVMVTARGQENLLKKAALEGAYSFVIKPFEEKKIVNLLKNL